LKIGSPAKAQSKPIVTRSPSGGNGKGRKINNNVVKSRKCKNVEDNFNFQGDI
jgi:hypothetical protein